MQTSNGNGKSRLTGLHIPAIDTRSAPKTLADWLANPELLKEPEALIQGLAYPGRTTLLYAREKTGKSTLSAQAIAALTTGRDYLTNRLTATPVLWYCIDEPIRDCIQRFAHMNADAAQLHISDQRPSAAQLTAEAQSTSAGLVVIDTLTELWRGRVEDSKNSDQIAAFLDPYTRATRELNIALLLQHHSPKRGNDFAGAQALGAKVDILAHLRTPHHGNTDDVDERVTELETDDGRRILEVRGRGVPHRADRLTFTRGLYALGDSPRPLPERIDTYIRTNGQTSASTLARELRARKTDVLAALRNRSAT